MFYCFPIHNASEIKINIQQIIRITSRHRNNPVLEKIHVSSQTNHVVIFTSRLHKYKIELHEKY